MAAALANAGCLVSALTPPGHPVRLLKAAPQLSSYRPFRPLDALETAFEKTIPDLVIPCDESAVRHLHQLHRATSRPATRRLIERSLGDPRHYRVSETRNDLLLMAETAGVRVPRTYAVDDLADLRTLSPQEPLPWVIKSDGSHAGQGVHIVASLPEAEAAFLKLHRPVSGTLALNKLMIDRDPFWLRQWHAGTRPAVSLQTYIEGRPANCSVACWEGEVLAAIAAEVITAESRTGPSMIVRSSTAPRCWMPSPASCVPLD